MSTDERTIRLSALGERLEQQYRQHTQALTELTEHARRSRDTTAVTRIVDLRQALADTAHALQRLAEGEYGTCQGCHRDIPMTRLEGWPHASHCPRCSEVAAAGRGRRPDRERQLNIAGRVH